MRTRLLNLLTAVTVLLLTPVLGVLAALSKTEGLGSVALLVGGFGVASWTPFAVGLVVLLGGTAPTARTRLLAHTVSGGGVVLGFVGAATVSGSAALASLGYGAVLTLALVWALRRMDRVTGAEPGRATPAADRDLLSPGGLRQHRRRVGVVFGVVATFVACAWLALISVADEVETGDLGFGLASAMFLGGLSSAFVAPRAAWVAMRSQMVAADGSRSRMLRIRRAVSRSTTGDLAPDDHVVAVRWARTTRAATQLTLQGSAPMLVGLCALQAASLARVDQPPWQAVVSIGSLVLFPALLVIQLWQLVRLRRFLAGAGPRAAS